MPNAAAIAETIAKNVPATAACSDGSVPELYGIPLTVFDNSVGALGGDRPATQADIDCLNQRLFNVRRAALLMAAEFPTIAADFALADAARVRIRRDLRDKLGRWPTADEFDAAVQEFLNEGKT